MNLDINDWKEFVLNKLFIIKYGVNLELNACEETVLKEKSSVNFVSRTSENNGVSSRVSIMEDIEPQNAGLISVAGGGSVLSTFLQNEPFYSGRDLYTLESKENISDNAKLFIITIIEQNKYKYSYGRQANKTLPYLKLKLPIKHNENGTPIIDETKKYSVEGYIPDWKWMEDYIISLHHKPLITKNKSGQAPDLNICEWKEFVFDKIFNIKRGESLYITDTETGETPYASASSENNGVSQHLDINPNCRGNCLVINYDGSVGDAYYQPDPFFASEKIVVVTYKDVKVNPYNALFITSVIKQEKYRFSYGRKWTVESSMKKSVIKLPVKHNTDRTLFIDNTHKYSEEGYVPDWEFMEEYIKSLPYGDRI